MVKLELFATGELVEIQRYLHVWNEAERSKRLNKNSRSNGCQEIGREGKVGHAASTSSGQIDAQSGRKSLRVT